MCVCVCTVNRPAGQVIMERCGMNYSINRCRRNPPTKLLIVLYQANRFYIKVSRLKHINFFFSLRPALSFRRYDTLLCSFQLTGSFHSETSGWMRLQQLAKEKSIR